MEEKTGVLSSSLTGTGCSYYMSEQRIRPGSEWTLKPLFFPLNTQIVSCSHSPEATLNTQRDIELTAGAVEWQFITPTDLRLPGRLRV